MQLYIVLNFVIIINHWRQKIQGKDDLQTVLKKEITENKLHNRFYMEII